MTSAQLNQALEKIVGSADGLACLTLMCHLPDEALKPALPWPQRVVLLETLVLAADQPLSGRLWERLSHLGWMDGVWNNHTRPGDALPSSMPNLMIRLLTHVPAPDDRRRAFWEACVVQGLRVSAGPWSSAHSERFLVACLNQSATQVADRCVKTGHVDLLSLSMNFTHVVSNRPAAWEWLTRHVDPMALTTMGRPVWWCAALDTSGRCNQEARSWGRLHQPDVFKSMELTEYFLYIGVTRSDLLCTRLLSRPDWASVTNEQGLPAVWDAASRNSEVLDLLPEDQVPWSCANADGEDLWFSVLACPSLPSHEVVGKLSDHHRPTLPLSGKGWLAKRPELFDRLADLPNAFWAEGNHAQIMWAGSPGDLESLGQHLWDARWVQGSEPHGILEKQVDSLNKTGRLRELPDPLREWWALWAAASIENEQKAQTVLTSLAIDARALIDRVESTSTTRPTSSFGSVEHPNHTRMVARLRHAAAQVVSLPSSPRPRLRP